jgi:isopentenyl diphosphate isomerase/L-lactate dehydrogenase-like FMN-dependent dehydrogenase
MFFLGIHRVLTDKADVVKATGLGAKAVLVGTPIIYGLKVAEELSASHGMRCIPRRSRYEISNLLS